MTNDVRTKSLRIRLVGGPAAHEFHVFDADTGEQLTNVMSVEFELCRPDPPVVTVRLFGGLVTDIALNATVEMVDVATGAGTAG